MANARYWRAAILGRWTTGEWAGEMAQTGISGVCIESGGNLGPVINATLPTFIANATGDVGTWAYGSVQFGSVGPGNWGKDEQTSLAEALYRFGNMLRPYLSGQFQWEEVRVAALDEKDDYINGASVFSMTTPLAGTMNTVDSPTQALVVSVRSGGRKPRNRGRMFVPFHKVNTSGSSYLVPSVDRLDVMERAVELFTDARVLPGQLFPAVVSRTHLTYSDVTELRIGDQFDNMSSRRRQVPENYIAEQL